MSIAQDKVVDKYALEDEAVKQSGLIYDYMKELAEAEKELDYAKIAHSVLEAEIAMKARKKGKLPDDVKITEMSMKEYLAGHSDLKDSSHKISDGYYNVKMHKAAVVAIEHRKSMIKILDNLDARRYYNTDGPERETRTVDTDEAIDAHLNRDR